MSKLPWKPILAWILAAFFVFGGAVNISAPESVAADYQRWGYPDWFHFATGGLERTTAVLLALAGTRLLGAALGSVVMLRDFADHDRVAASHRRLDVAPDRNNYRGAITCLNLIPSVRSILSRFYRRTMMSGSLPNDRHI
jgi:hypothetical protein